MSDHTLQVGELVETCNGVAVVWLNLYGFFSFVRLLDREQESLTFVLTTDRKIDSRRLRQSIEMRSINQQEEEQAIKFIEMFEAVILHVKICGGR